MNDEKSLLQTVIALYYEDDSLKERYLSIPGYLVN